MYFLILGVNGFIVELCRDRTPVRGWVSLGCKQIASKITSEVGSVNGALGITSITQLGVQRAPPATLCTTGNNTCIVT